jgi:hypothetical protein
LVVERLRSSDRALTEACADLPADAHASAFAHSLDIALSDGDLSQDKSTFLNALVRISTWMKDRTRHRRCDRYEEQVLRAASRVDEDQFRTCAIG